MNIKEFMANYTNHPVLFIGTGMSLRYLDNSYTWDGLLEKIAVDLYGDDREYLNIKSRHMNNGYYQFEEIAEELEAKFNENLEKNNEEKFKEVNELFFEKMRSKQEPANRFKIYIAKLLEKLNYKESANEEIAELKKARKNIGSIITTNYDNLAQDIFEFNPLIGNNILLSNPYGSVYKIHGCVNNPAKIIITSNDYKQFKEKYELIRAQLLSLFIHNPIIFLGYNVGDENIKEILKTIFTYVEPNSEMATKIRSNFLLVEFEAGSNNSEIVEHDIVLPDFATIRINKIKTDNFIQIYKTLAELSLPISAMDVRKFQSVAKEIYSGGNIKVSFTEDIDSLNNGDKVVAIGSTKTIQYNYQTTVEMMSNYFKIMEEENSQLIALLDKHKISSNQWFPIYGFSSICHSINNEEKLKTQQMSKLQHWVAEINPNSRHIHHAINDILSNNEIAPTYKENTIAWNFWENNISESEIVQYLKNYNDKKSTNYRKLLCMYDYKKYS